MPTVFLSDETYAKVKSAADPFVDTTPDPVISRAVDYYLKHNGTAPKNGHPGHGNKVDLIRLPVGSQELRHTRLLSAAVDGSELHRPDWNSLMRDMHITARQRLGSYEAVRNASPANLRQDRFEENGYRFLPEAGFSVQGCDANKSCECAFRLAKAMNIALRVTFEWRDKDDAAHPGRIGEIEWSPIGALPEAGSGDPVKWRKATAEAILRLTGGVIGAEFTLAELQENELERIVADTGSDGKTPNCTLRKVCQQLRDAGMIEFVDDRGTYRLLKRQPTR